MSTRHARQILRFERCQSAQDVGDCVLGVDRDECVYRETGVSIVEHCAQQRLCSRGQLALVCYRFRQRGELTEACGNSGSSAPVEQYRSLDLFPGFVPRSECYEIHSGGNTYKCDFYLRRRVVETLVDFAKPGDRGCIFFLGQEASECRGNLEDFIKLGWPGAH